MTSFKAYERRNPNYKDFVQFEVDGKSYVISGSLLAEKYLELQSSLVDLRIDKDSIDHSEGKDDHFVPRVIKLEQTKDKFLKIYTAEEAFEIGITFHEFKLLCKLGGGIVNE